MLREITGTTLGFLRVTVNFMPDIFLPFFTVSIASLILQKFSC